jgi:hypothetical protein
MTDSRQQERLHVLSYVRVEEEDGAEAASKKLVDITTAGMRLRGKVPLEPEQGCRFVLHLPRPGREAQKVCFEAHVIWSRPAEDPGFWDCGIELLDIDRSDLKAIERFIEETSYPDRFLTVSTSFYDEID